MMDRVTRRRFSGLAAAVAAAAAQGGAQAQTAPRMTAAELIRRLASSSGVTPPERSPDGLKAGDEQATVNGVAVTSMATLDVLQKAARARLDFVVTFEPTFYGRLDGLPPATTQGPGARVLSPDDPILLAKRKFIQNNGMVIYRLHDQWAGRAQNEHARALASAMGWSRAAPGGDPGTDYVIAPTRLIDLVPEVRAKLSATGGLRVVGDPATRIERVTVMPGLRTLAQLMAKLPQTDLLLVGESRDWEGPEYVGDAASAGLNKAMITIGRVVSEDPGMRACAEWIRGLAPGMPVQWFAAGEPFGRPA